MLLQVTSSKRKEKFKNFEVKKTPLLSATVRKPLAILSQSIRTVPRGLERVAARPSLLYLEVFQNQKDTV